MSSAGIIQGKSVDVGSGAGDLTLQVARNVAAVEQLRETWEAWQEHPNSVIDNYLAWFTQDKSSRPHVMVVYRDGCPDCLLIGKLLRNAVISGFARLIHSDARVLYFIDGGLLGNASAENCGFLVRTILAELRRGEAGAAEFFGVPLGSALYGATMQIPNFFCRDHFPARIVHRYLMLPDSLQDFLSGLPAKERENLRYREKRLLKKFPGQVRVGRFWREDDVDHLVDDAEMVAKKTYQRAVNRGFKVSEDAGLRAEARAGSLRGYVLYIEEKPCAFLIASWRKGILYGTYAGHDPKYNDFSPGRYLLMRCVEDCLVRNRVAKTVMIDPGHGDQAYKRLFTNAERQDAHVAIYAPTLAGFVRNVGRMAFRFGAYCLKGLLVKSKLLPLIRSQHRRQAIHKSRQSQDVRGNRPSHRFSNRASNRASHRQPN
jgi:hypothetical protein